MVDDDISLNGKSSISNEGWGPARDVELFLGFNEDCSVAPPPVAQLRLRQISRNPPIIDISSLVAAELRRAVTRSITTMMCLSPFSNCMNFNRPVECTKVQEEWCTAFSKAALPDVQAMKARAKVELAYLPVSSERYVCVRGDVHHRNVNGEQKIFRFTQKQVYLGNPDLGKGAPMPPSAQYNVMLDSSKSGYTLSVPVSHVLRNGEADHFVPKIGSDRSARYLGEVKIMAGEKSSRRSISI
jgi:hypothetical protein